jgi:hypothetical protein
VKAHPVINDELVHATWAESGPDGIHYRHTRIDVADQLRLSLTRIRTLFQKNNLWLLRTGTLEQFTVSRYTGKIEQHSHTCAHAIRQPLCSGLTIIVLTPLCVVADQWSLILLHHVKTLLKTPSVGVAEFWRPIETNRQRNFAWARSFA